MKHSSLYIDESYHWRGCNTVTVALGASRRTGLASSGPFNLWTASGCIAYTTNIGCFAVLARDQNCALSGLNAGFSDRLLAKLSVMTSLARASFGWKFLF